MCIPSLVHLEFLHSVPTWGTALYGFDTFIVLQPDSPGGFFTWVHFKFPRPGTPQVQPVWFFLNVPGLVNCEYTGLVLFECPRAGNCKYHRFGSF